MTPHWGYYNPAAWGWKAGPAAAIVPYSFRGYPFPQGVARGTERLWNDALTRLLTGTGFTLPPNNAGAGMWGYENRVVAGSNTPSFHAFGLALDLAAPWNPSHTVPPAGPHRMPVDTALLLHPLGIEWGGSWSTSEIDWMHIEIHLGPQDIPGVLLPAPRPGGSPMFPLPAGCYYGPYLGPAESISGSGLNDSAFRPGLALAQARLRVFADGYYGPVTAAAARSWQQAHHLVADGLIGPATWSSLFP